MKISVLFKQILITCLTALAITTWTKAQTYTTVANGAWSNASTWQGGVVPPTSGTITSAMVINIKHVVTYSNSNINNSGTINISNPGGVTPRLIIASGINFTNAAGGKLYLINGELRQYRFAGGGESGTSQNGNFINNGGYLSAQNSFVEIAQSWTNQGTEVFNNCSLELGQGYTVNGGTTIDTLAFTSVSVGMQGSGDFSITNGKIYFKTLRVEVASSSGQFVLNNGTINGSIDYITLKNHLTNAYSNNKLTVASAVVTSGLSLNAYCVANAGKYKPNGKLSGNQTQDCSLNYFPAPLMYGTNSSRLNFSTDPVLVSGTDKQVGAQYKYEGVAPGMDALLHIDSIVNGAVINTIDDNTGANGGYIEAFQPIITSGPAVGSSYAVFNFNYKVTGTATDLKVDTAVITALDIDGATNLHEFDQISLGAGAGASFLAINPLISLTQIVSGTFKGLDLSSIAHPGVDTSSKGNMFTITNKKISSFTAKLGILTTSAQQTQRLFSLYAKSFNYANAITLPIKLASFTAMLNDKHDKVNLKWTTASEENVSHFLVERSTDGVNYSSAGLVFAVGNSSQDVNYSLPDDITTIRSTVIYYRICSVDIDGKYEYSSIRTVNLGTASNSISLTVYPNPVVNNLRITLPKSWQNKHVTIDLYNSNGQHVSGLNASNSSQTESISVTGLQKGVYFVKANCGGEIASQQIIKN